MISGGQTGARALACFFAVSFFASPLLAENKTAAKQYVKEANVQYRLGRFKEALAAYSKAYEAYAHPAVLFNIGQCHRQLNNCEQAIFFFKQYLTELEDPDNQKVVTDLISDCEKELERERQAKAAAAAAERVAQQQRAAEEARRFDAQQRGRPGSVRAPASGATTPPVARVVDTGPGWYEQWWAWAIIGGVVVAGTATVILLWPQDVKTVAPTGPFGNIDRRGILAW